MAVSVELVRALRDQTGAGIMECKEALESTDGDLEKATAVLREKGRANVAKRISRDTHEGVVETYVHTGGRFGAIVELGCETDFVARTEEFQKLAYDIAMQVAAMAPAYVDSTDIPERADGNAQEACLMQQPYIKDPTKTVQDLVNEMVGKLGENVRVRRFSRFSLGE